MVEVMGFAGSFGGGGQTTEDPDHKVGEDVIAARTEPADVREEEAGVMWDVRLVTVEECWKYCCGSRALLH